MKKFLLIPLSFFLFSNAIAQICPIEIEVARQIKNVATGWQDGAKSETLNLIGIGIFVGENLNDSDSPPTELVPEFSGNKRYWRFKGSIGTTAMWLVCGYGNSTFLRSRIHPDVVECIEKTEKPKKKGGKVQTVSAMCISSEISPKE